jgi:hypothetical protein
VALPLTQGSVQALTSTALRSCSSFRDDAAKVFVFPQPDNLRMPQPIPIGPFEKFDLRHRFWPQPNGFLHLLGAEFLHQIEIVWFRTNSRMGKLASRDTSMSRTLAAGRPARIHSESEPHTLADPRRSSRRLESRSPSGLPVTRAETHTATDDPVRWPDGLNGLSIPRPEPPSGIFARRVAMARGRRRDTLLPSRTRQRRGPRR